MATADNPILNTPYDEPARHYATDSQGNLNYKDVGDGRRVFTPDVPQVPVGQQAQGGMFDLNDLCADYREHLVNQTRDATREWRPTGYRGVTSQVPAICWLTGFPTPGGSHTRSCFLPSRKLANPRSGLTSCRKVEFGHP